MYVRLLGLASVLLGLGLLYVARRAWRDISRIPDEQEWEDAVYGPPMNVVEAGLLLGVLFLLLGLALAFRLF